MEEEQKILDMCKSGTQQSPIILKTADAITCSHKCKLMFYYRSSRCNLSRSGNVFYIDYDQGSHVLYNGEVYELEKISFTSPTSHIIDKSSGAIEAHLYHKSPTTGDLLILAVLYEVNEASSSSKNFFDSFAHLIPKTDKSITINTASDWDAFNMLPESKSFFAYKGSLINFPCSEGVQWIVMANFANISEMTYRKISSIVGNNARKQQPINKRDVFYSSNLSSKNNLNQSNPIKCMTDKEFRNKCKLLYEKDEKKDKIFGDTKVLLSILIIMTFLFILIIVVFVKYGVFEKFLEFWRNLKQVEIPISAESIKLPSAEKISSLKIPIPEVKLPTMPKLPKIPKISTPIIPKIK